MSVDPPEHGAPEQSPTEALAQLEVGRVVPRGLLVAAGWLVIFLLLSAALLHGMVDLSALRGIATEARLGPLAASFLLLFGGLVFMGLRWRALMPRPERVGRAGMVGICASGQLLNMALPGPVGELVAAALVQRRYGVETPVALAASIHARFVGVTSAAVITLLIWLAAPMPVPESARPFMWGAVVMVGFWGGSLGVLAAWPGLMLRPAGWLRRWLQPRARHRPVRWLDAFLEQAVRFGEALSTMGRHLGRPHMVAAGWNLLGVLSVSGGAWLASWALGHPGHMAGMVFSQCALTAGAVVLFAVPGMQVGWDAAFATLMVTTVGLPLEHALAITVLVRFQQLAVVSIGALVLGTMLRAPRSAAPVTVDATPAPPG
jgi:hypothetical protein